MSAFMKEIDAVQTDMIMMESMLDALAISVYNGIRAECIGNSLEILAEYMAARSERLDHASITGKILSDKYSGWETFIADGSNKSVQSEEMDAAYKKISPHLEKLPEGIGKALYPVIRDIAAASRKQGFMEGFTAVAGRLCGEGSIG